MAASRISTAPETATPAAPTSRDSAVGGAVQESARTPGGRRTPEAYHSTIDPEARLRLRLQRRAPENMRRAMLRSARRLSVLLLADLASFWVMRELLRALRDEAALGAWVSSVFHNLLPRGTLSGFQYAAALLLSLLITGNYGRGRRRRDPRRLFIACAVATALPLWMRIWTRGVGSVVVEYSLTTVLVWIGLVVERMTLDRALSTVYPPEQNAVPTLFVGPADLCRAAEASPAFSALAGHQSVGFVDVVSPPSPEARGEVADFAKLLHDSHAESVVVCGHFPAPQFDIVVDAALTSGCQLLTVPRQIQLPGVQPEIVPRDGGYVVELSAPSLKWRQLLVKRVFDFALSALGTIVISPLLAVIALAVKLDSPGPVFFRQERLGRGGRRFRVWKFRTMRDGASDATHRALVSRMIAGDDAGTAHTSGDGAKIYKLVEDGRVTRVGRWLRRRSLDELPQLFNVVLGDMSLVGPRPPLDYEVEEYDQWQYGRLQVWPGITGLWQVSGRNLLTYRQMCELDMRYVREWSLALDLKILFKTIPVVLLNSGRAA